MGERLPPPVSGVDVDRTTAVDVHQLRAGHWSKSTQYLHRIGRAPSRQCEQCNDVFCRGGLCPLCREEADIPFHVLVRCKALMAARIKKCYTINPDPEEVRGSDVVATLAAAYSFLQSQLTTPR